MFTDLRISLLHYLSKMQEAENVQLAVYTQGLPNVCTHQPKHLSHTLRTVCHIKLQHQEKC